MLKPLPEEQYQHPDITTLRLTTEGRLTLKALLLVLVGPCPRAPARRSDSILPARTCRQLGPPLHFEKKVWDKTFCIDRSHKPRNTSHIFSGNLVLDAEATQTTLQLKFVSKRLYW